MIELVVFDIAGTTIKDKQYVQKVLAETVAPYVAKIPQEHLQAVMGWPKPKALKYLVEANRDKPVSEAFATQLNKNFVGRMIAFFQGSNHLAEIEGATATLVRLRENGIKTALDTGFSRQIADVIIEKLGWESLLDATVASDEVARGRPAPDMIYHLMDKLNITDVKCVAKVGDTEADIRQGQKAGCGLVIAVTSGSGTEEELQALKPDYIINDVRGIPALLKL